MIVSQTFSSRLSIPVPQSPVGTSVKMAALSCLVVRSAHQPASRCPHILGFRYSATTTKSPPLFSLPFLSRSLARFLHPCQSQHLASPLPALASLDVDPNLRHPSHIPAISTEQRKRERELTQAQQRTDENLPSTGSGTVLHGRIPYQRQNSVKLSDRSLIAHI